MRKLFILALALLVAGTPLVAHAFGQNSGKLGENEVELEDLRGRDVNPDGAQRPAPRPAEPLRFNSMIGVSEAFLGTELIREGVPGAGAEWVVGSAAGRLAANGELTIDVRGLVLADGGTNPSEVFRGTVSCIAPDGTTMNVSTGDFPVDIDGNARISEVLSFSAPCLAPIVFVTGDGGQWFAVNGNDFAVVPAPPVEPPVEPPLEPPVVEDPAAVDLLAAGP